MREIIRLDNITAGYDGHPQIRNITLGVPERAFLGITGPNGGGKTTLLRVMLGLLRPMEGSVSYFREGRRVDSLRMGYLPQRNAIDRHFPISVHDTVLSGLCAVKRLCAPFTARHHAMVADTLRFMGIADLAARPVKALSGGQLQRVLMARALVARPEVLVLDEPDSYLDEPFKERLHGLLAQVNAHCAVIMVSHDARYIRSAARQTVCVNETLALSEDR